MLRKLILFTSGLDSTYLVYKSLKEGYNVDVIYNDIENNKDKSLIEKQNTKQLIKLFKDEFGHDKINDLNELNNYNNFLITQKTSFDLIQLVIHLFNISLNLRDSQRDFYNEINIGYVMNDCAVSYIKEIEEVYINLCKFTFKYDGEKYPELKFPLIKYDKVIISDLLPVKYHRFIWTCENPIVENNKYIKRCGECDTCLKQKQKNIYDKFVDKFKIKQK